MVNRRNISTITIGCVAVFVTLILFVVAFGLHSFVDYAALMFILLAEAGSTFGIMVIDQLAEKMGGTMTRAGGLGVFGAYLIATVVAAFFFMTFLPFSAAFFIGVEIIILALAIVAIIVSVNTSAEANSHNNKTTASVVSFEKLINQAMLLKEDSQNAKYAKGLEKVYEELRYSDVSSYVQADSLIGDKLFALETLLEDSSENGTSQIEAEIEAILGLIKKRAVQASQMKAGKI